MSTSVSLPVGHFAPFGSTLRCSRSQDLLGLYMQPRSGAWAPNSVSVETATKEISALNARKSITQ
jgi:hypothetical protein